MALPLPEIFSPALENFDPPSRGGWKGALQRRRVPFQRAYDCLDDEARIPQDVAVRKSKDTESLPGKPLSPTSVILEMAFITMLIAVELDDELGGRAIEIDDIGPNRLLTTKPNSRDLFAA